MTKLRVSLHDPAGIPIESRVFTEDNIDELREFVSEFVFTQGFDPDGDEPLAGSVHFDQEADNG
jgi:hypothetical protein